MVRKTLKGAKYKHLIIKGKKHERMYLRYILETLRTHKKYDFLIFI